jgi:hypothetical protein
MTIFSTRALVPVAFVLLALVACGGDDDNSGASATSSASSSGSGANNTCESVCTSSNFTGGTEMKFDKVTECLCAGGTRGNIQKARCEGYCAQFAVNPGKSLVTRENATTGNDKCVCDGT